MDLFSVETFFDLAELESAIAAVRSVSSLPILAMLTFDEQAETLAGVTARDAVNRLEELEVAAVGANHGAGIQAALRALNAMSGNGLPLAAMPNIGLASMAGNRIVYPHATPDYFAEFAAHARSLGARVIGGCCGTTPTEIAAIAEAVAEDRAPTAPLVFAEHEVVVRLAEEKEETELARMFREGEFVVSVQIDPPSGGSYVGMLDVARTLQASGKPISSTHCGDMVAARYFAHDTPDGTDMVDRILAAGYARGRAGRSARTSPGAPAARDRRPDPPRVDALPRPQGQHPAAPVPRDRHRDRARRARRRRRTTAPPTRRTSGSAARRTTAPSGRAGRHIGPRRRRRALASAAAVADISPPSRAPLRPRPHRGPRAGRRAAVRRDRPRAARRAGRALALQRRRDRPPAGSRRPRPLRPRRADSEWREDGIVVPTRARAVGARAGLHRPRRPPPHAPRAVRARARRGLRPGPDPPARAHPSGPEGGPAAAHPRHAGEPVADLLALRRRRVVAARRTSTARRSAR